MTEQATTEVPAAIVDLDHLAGQLNETMADMETDIASAATVSPYIFSDGKGGISDPLASTKTPDWVREHAMPLPIDEAGNVLPLYTSETAMRLLANVEDGKTVTTLAKLFPHGSVRNNQTGEFPTARVSAKTVEHSLVIVIPGFDASRPLGGLETAKVVKMSEIAVPDGDRFIVPANAMANRIKINTNDAGEVVDFMLLSGCELSIYDSKAKLSIWDEASTSVRVGSIGNLTGQAKQLLAAMKRMEWVCQYRQTLAEGESANGDTYHTVLVRLGTNYHGMPYGTADRKNDVRDDGVTPVIRPKIHSRLVGLDDPSGRAKDLPGSYCWKGFSGIFA